MRRKWRFKVGDSGHVFVKRHEERTEHVLMKAFLWALYREAYPELIIEPPLIGRFRPDLVSVTRDGHPVFWAEAGHVGRQKLARLLRKYPACHFAFAKWNTDLRTVERWIRREAGKAGLSRPVDLIGFPADSAERFIDGDGRLRVPRRWIRRLDLAEAE